MTDKTISLDDYKKKDRKKRSEAKAKAQAEVDAKRAQASASGSLVNPPGEPMPNARRFLRSEHGHEEHCLLIQQGGQFYRWDGTCWPTLEDPILKSELYKWFEDKDYVEGKDLKPFAPTVRKVADLIDATRAITIIRTTTPTPSWLLTDAGHQADQIIACENGLVHWPTRELLEHRPGFYIHHSVPFSFDPNAPQPTRWLAFLDELWPGDADTIGTVQEMLGYMVSGDTKQQKMFLLVGPKRGGKGTIGRVLTRMIGRHNVAGPTLASLGTNFGLQDLIGKPVALISDARIGDKSDASLIAERLLSISGEDLQNVDRKYLPPWSGYLPTRFVVLTNELPKFKDASGALASRFIVLMLSKSFYDKENPALTEELCQELPSIFNWSLEGLQMLRARGRFVQPQTSRDAIQQLEDLASPVGAFIRDHCSLGPDKSIEVDALYKHYRQWSEDNGLPASSRQVFGRDLRAVRPEVKVTRIGGHHSADRTRTYAGLTIRNIADALDADDADESCVQGVRGRDHCSNSAPCAACDGLGCPTCKPERFGLPPKSLAAKVGAAIGETQ
jgi:putative DNA primase/helicase